MSREGVRVLVVNCSRVRGVPYVNNDVVNRIDPRALEGVRVPRLKRLGKYPKLVVVGVRIRDPQSSLEL